MLSSILFYLFIICLLFLMLSFLFNLSPFSYSSGIEKIKKFIKIGMALSFIYAVAYLNFYQYFEDKNLSKDIAKQNASKITFAPIDEEMMKLIEEQAQREIENSKKQVNAYQAFSKAKNHLKSEIGSLETISFEPDWDCIRDEDLYMVSFKANITAADQSIIRKKYTFFLVKDESSAVDNIWEILDHKESVYEN